MGRRRPGTNDRTGRRAAAGSPQSPRPRTGGRALRVVALAAALSAIVGTAASVACAADASGLVRYEVVGDGIPRPLVEGGDARRGQSLVASRDATCTLCHRLPAAGPGLAPPAGGDIGPPLAGAGSRWTVAQLRLRIVDPRRLSADSVMPAYYRVDGLRRVADAVAGRPVLDAGQIEDVVTWLASLKE